MFRRALKSFIHAEEKILCAPIEEMSLEWVNFGLAFVAIAFCLRTWWVITSYIEAQPVRYAVSRPYTGGFTKCADGADKYAANVMAGSTEARSRLAQSARVD